MTIISAAFHDLENKIRVESEAARAAIKIALRHARDAGLAYERMRGFVTQSELNQWLATSGVDRHTVMVMRRISMCENLDAKTRTLADLAFDRMAEYVAQGSHVPSRAERIEQNRKLREKINSAADVPCRR
jgi:hypothetical protein